MAQIDFKAEEFDNSRSKIRVDIRIINDSPETIKLSNFQTKLNYISYFYSLDILRDSVNNFSKNFTGFIVLKSDGEYIEIEDYFPGEINHKSKLSNWISLFWLKFKIGIKQLFDKDVIRIHAHSNKSKTIKIDLEGLVMPPGEYYLQILYFLNSEDQIIRSNKVNFSY